MNDFDVCVIGAGPAGATTAMLLAHQGRRVALLDRAQFPRDKICGDGITPRGARALTRVGSFEAVESVARAHRGVSIRGGDGRSFSIEFTSQAGSPSDLLVLPRMVLDDILVKQAVSAGACWMPGQKVVDVRETADACEIISEGGARLQAAFTVLATGAESQLLRRAGVLAKKPPVDHAARAYFENVEGLDDHVTLFFDGVDLPGYGWIFPVGSHAANIGCGVFDSRGSNQSARLAKLIDSHPLLAAMLRNAHQASPIKSYPLRTDFHPDYAGVSRRACVGEAAGLVNPITGEGIDYAIESAEFLAQAMASQWSTGRAPGAVMPAYRDLLARRFSLRFRLYRWLQHRCLSERNALKFLAGVERSPVLQRCVVDGLFGRARPRDLLRPGVLLPVLRLALAH